MLNTGRTCHWSGSQLGGRDWLASSNQRQPHGVENHNCRQVGSCSSITGFELWDHSICQKPLDALVADGEKGWASFQGRATRRKKKGVLTDALGEREALDGHSRVTSSKMSTVMLV